MLATIRNMKRLEESGENQGVFAYSPETYERYSACSSDYFMMSDDECITDSEGYKMILARESRRIVRVRSSSGPVRRGLGRV